MKKLKTLFISLLVTFTINCYAQAEFKCDQIIQDFDKWQELANQYKSKGNKKWSKEIMKTWQLNSDGAIQWQYVITIDSLISIADYEDYIGEWIKMEYQHAVPLYDKVNHSIKLNAQLMNIGKSTGLFSCTLISAEQELVIDLKENKFRITLLTRHYRVASASLGGVDTPLTGISDAYPYNEKSDYKDAYAMAYININSNEISKCKSFLSFLNRHINDINNDKDNW